MDKSLPTLSVAWIYYVMCAFILPGMADLSYRTSLSSHGSKCSFPDSWHGTWFLHGLGDFEIRKHYMGQHGHCFSHDGGNKYLLLQMPSITQKCYRCIVFTQKHANLIQYKQGYCVPTDDMRKACSDITSDFPLHTIVKTTGTPIPCPFQGHQIFTYVNRSESCDDPTSTIRACADRSKFIFNHRKCPQVSNTYEKVESFQCFASWSNGVDHYLYGRFTGPLIKPTQKKFRCFMYEKFGTTCTMSMTADATCQGLQHPEVGMNLYALHSDTLEWPQSGCQFPEFFASNEEWRDITGRKRYKISKRQDEMAIWDIGEPRFMQSQRKTEDWQETKRRATCISEMASVESGQQKRVDLKVYVTNDDCESSYRCIRLTQRKEGVVNIQIGQASDSTFNPCEGSMFQNAEKRVLIHLPEDGVIPPKACPLPGMYSYVDPKTSCHGSLDVGCSRSAEIVVDAKCQGKESADVLQCYDSWTENDRVYLIAGRLGNLRSAADCLVYKVTSKGHQLEADASCISDGIKFMGRHISYILDTPNKSCNTATTRPTEILRTEKHKPRKEKGIYETQPRPNINSADVLDTHHGGSQRTTSKYINQSVVQSHSSILLFLALWVGFFLQR